MSNSSVTKIEFSASPKNCSVIKLHSNFFAFLLLLLLNGSINADALEPINIQGPSCADMGMVNVGGVCQNLGGGGFGGGSGGVGAGGGGGGGSPGSSSANPRSTPGEASECSSVQTLRIAEATQQIRAAVGAIGCAQQRHRNKFWEVDFPDGKTGIYFGVGDCRASLNNTEIESPDC